MADKGKGSTQAEFISYLYFTKAYMKEDVLIGSSKQLIASCGYKKPHLET
jgi:hypothetical protein